MRSPFQRSLCSKKDVVGVLSPWVARSWPVRLVSSQAMRLTSRSTRRARRRQVLEVAERSGDDEESAGSHGGIIAQLILAATNILTRKPFLLEDRGLRAREPRRHYCRRGPVCH